MARLICIAILSLPSWLLNPTLPALEDTVPGTGADTADEFEFFTTRVQVNGESGYPSKKEQIKACRSVDEIREVTRANGWTFSESKVFDGLVLSSFAFDHILGLRVPWSQILDFWENPDFNPPAARNIMTLLRSPTLKESVTSLEDLETWIGQEVTLGRIAEDDILEILKGLLNRYQLPKGLEAGPMLTFHTSWNLYRRILDGLRASKVRSFDTLRIRTTLLLLQLTSHSPTLVEGRDMGVMIMSRAPKCQLEKMRPAVVDFIIHSFRLKSSIVPSTGSIGDKHLIWRLRPLLMSLPEGIAIACIAKITFTLVKRASSWSAFWKTDRSEPLRTWFEGLHTLPYVSISRKHIEWRAEWKAAEKVLAKLDRRTLAAYLSLLRLQEQVDFILEHWILQQSRSLSDPVALDALLSGKETPPRFTGIANPCWIDLAPILYELDTVTLDSMMPKLRHLLTHLGESKAIKSISNHVILRRQSDDPKTYSKITKTAKTDALEAIKLFKKNRWLRLEKCPDLAQSIIEHPRIDPEVIFDELARDHGIFGAVKPFHGAQDLPVNMERVDMLHSIASAFADAERLNPRQAYRKVMRCFAYFQGRLDLVRPEMVQAMYRAGVTRYFEAHRGVSDAQLDHILVLVRQVEGDEVADRLEIACMWSNRRLQGKI